MDDKRNSIRYPLCLSVEIDHLSVGRAGSSCLITDISRNGCRIVNVPLSLLEKKQFKLKASIPSEKKTVDLNAKVRWSAQGQKQGCCGCTIEEISRGDKFDLIDLAYKKWRAKGQPTCQ